MSLMVALRIVPALRRIDSNLLSPLGEYQLALVKRPGAGQACETLVEHVRAAFRDF